MNAWVMTLSPWGHAALIASGMQTAQLTGFLVVDWLRGDDLSLADKWGGLLAAWLVVFLAARLLVPGTLQTMRRQQQWREERRRQRNMESHDS